MPMDTAATMPICADPALAAGAFGDSVEFIGKLHAWTTAALSYFAIHIP
jgi:hypothetical protein